jgi:hypothetical protein
MQMCLSFDQVMVQCQIPSMTGSLLVNTMNELDSKEGEFYLKIHKKELKKFRTPSDFVLCKYLPIFKKHVRKFYKDGLTPMSKMISKDKIEDIDMTIGNKLKEIFFYIKEATEQ